MRSQVLLTVSLVFFCSNVFAEDTGDPIDIWYRGFLMLQSAEERIKTGDRLGGLNKLDEAFSILKQLPLEHPEFQSDTVNERLRLIANRRYRLAGVIKKRAPTRMERLEAELESLRDQSKQLQKRREAIELEIDELRDRERILPPPLPRFHERTDDEEGLFRAPYPDPKLFPDGRTEVESDEGTKFIIEPESPASKPVPDHWIPKPFEDETFYLIPLM
ncbi:MAG: hypothetical protein P1U58_10200 [Verrucomicrobiales bacterium]|nr:hypothetical protein [Verrucomicrobiales bacterium]